MNFYFMENQGDGKLISSVYSYIPNNGKFWTVTESVKGISTNFDGDPNDEFLQEMEWSNDASGSDGNESEVGYFNINKENKLN